MISDKMQKALNDQIQAEIGSAYLYLSMAAWFRSQNLQGAAGWMEKQAQEEWSHAMKFFHYIDERGGRILLQPLAGPQPEWASALAAFTDALGHERHISARIGKLVDLAREERDHATEAFLQWFVTEQVEEESSVQQVVDHLGMVSDSKHGLFMIDRELGSR